VERMGRKPTSFTPEVGGPASPPRGYRPSKAANALPSTT
jgi:hypothetical protein